MALWKGNAFEEGHAGSQMREGLVGSGRRRPEIGREARGRGEGSRPCQGGADMTGNWWILIGHGKRQGRRCPKDSQGHCFKDDCIEGTRQQRDRTV